MRKEYSLLPLHISHTVSLGNLHIPLDKIPREDADGYLSQEKYAKLTYEDILFEGGYGILQVCKRTDLSGTILDTLVKKPKNKTYLAKEAILQWIARKTLEPYGLERSIPQVYDIYSKSSIRFCMERIRGDFPYIYLAKVSNPDVFFFQLLLQVSVLLFFLEKDIYLDHRDLKANNLYIREEPVEYSLIIEGVSYTVSAPFRVVILDFGFACVGDESGLTKTNIAPDIFSNSDPCPKEGRDLFHLLTSFWSIPSIRERMSASTKAEVDSWLVNDTKDFSKLARKLTQSHWVYVVTGDVDFKYPKLSPLVILKRLINMGLNMS